MDGQMRAQSPDRQIWMWVPDRSDLKGGWGGRTGGGTKANWRWDVWPVDGGGWQPQVGVVTKSGTCMHKKSRIDELDEEWSCWVKNDPKIGGW